MILIRYANDIVVGFEKSYDAKRFQTALHKRMEQFTLTLHPEKTRLIEFGRFAAENRAQRGVGKPETFNFLSFTHLCGQNRKGGFQLIRRTRQERKREKLKEIKEELRKRMHHTVSQVGLWLGRVVRGFFAYYAVPTNAASLNAFRYHVMNLWRRALNRRSQKDSSRWDRMARLTEEWLPRPHILHPWPEVRFAAKHSR